METLAPFVTAITTAIALLSAVWILRRTKRVDSVHFIFSIGIIVFTMYHFYACGVLGIINPMHGIITGLFISSVAWVNAYCSTCNNLDSVVNIGIDRRKEPPITRRRVSSDDRRKINSHTIFKSIAKTGN